MNHVLSEEHLLQRLLVEQTEEPFDPDDALGVVERGLGDAVGGDLVRSESVADPGVDDVERRDDQRLLPPVQAVDAFGSVDCGAPLRHRGHCIRCRRQAVQHLSRNDARSTSARVILPAATSPPRVRHRHRERQSSSVDLVEDGFGGHRCAHGCGLEVIDADPHPDRRDGVVEFVGERGHGRLLRRARSAGVFPARRCHRSRVRPRCRHR